LTYRCRRWPFSIFRNIFSHIHPARHSTTRMVIGTFGRACLLGSVYLWCYRRRTICSHGYCVKHHHRRQWCRETPSTTAVATTVARWPAAFYSTARYASLRWSDHRNVHNTKIDTPRPHGEKIFIMKTPTISLRQL